MSAPLKTLHSLQGFPLKLPSSTSSSIKLKTLIHALIVSHVCRVIRALSRAKSVLIAALKKKNNKTKKIFFGSFRLHYNWCSSHVTPVPAPILDHAYYDSSWNSMISNDQEKNAADVQLSGYLQWLEEKKADEDSSIDRRDMNEIDKLAEMFIASCHEKFILEKQESYRRFQEMMARSM